MLGWLAKIDPGFEFRGVISRFTEVFFRISNRPLRRLLQSSVFGTEYVPSCRFHACA